ncbi:DUF1365 domain-containing protein [Caulobacter sp.]|uniref:DUF1365 domain-containing protein n=1 Tax=Caulobacter sp. TaxID=78 RepID=UPI003BAD6459
MTRGSAIYAGEVVHDRARPKRHHLRYRVFMLLLDLDELEDLDRELKRFSLNRFNLLSFFDRDHVGAEGQSAKAAVLDKLAGQGIVLADPRISLLCMPRVLGHGFNPLSVYFCHDGGGALAAIVYAVRNTFGGRHDYVLPVRRERGGWVDQGCAKTFHVSPFLPMDLRYAFEIAPPGQGVHVGVDTFDEQGLVLSASFDGARRELTDAALLRALLGHPWQVVGVLAAIVWEALKIVLKGFRTYPDPTVPPRQDRAQRKGGAG